MNVTDLSAQDAPEKRWIFAALAGLASCLVGIGIARFAYSPLLPMVIKAGWFEAADAAYLGAANLAGYLVGAAGARMVGARMATHKLVPLMMILCGLSFATCAFPAPFAWFCAWRFIGGAAGGVIMVLTASLVLANVPPERRGIAGGIMFTGVGMGIALGGVLVPSLAGFELGVTWTTLGAACLIVTVAALPLWKRMADPHIGDAAEPAGIAPDTAPLHAHYAIYALAAIGLVAPMVFLADYAARGLHMGVEGAGLTWVVFGIGGLFGAIAAGRLADAIGFRRAFIIVIAIEIVAVAAIPFAGTGPAFWLGALVTGVLVPGIVPLAAGRSHILAGRDPARRQRAWSRATVAFSLGQAAAGYALSYLYELTERHDLLFFASAAVAVAALALILIPSLNPESEA